LPHVHHVVNAPFFKRFVMSNVSYKVGFIGLGIMGAPMAANLAAAGHTLFVHTRSQVPQGLSQLGRGGRAG
jgi:UDP-N-acetylmuramoylalanine-D-glutamate ligase